MEYKKTRRLFVGIALPPEIKAELAPLPKIMEGARWLKPHNLHITIVFIGNVEEEKLAEIQQALTEIKFSPFSLKIKDVGFWRQGILWAGVNNTEEFSKLRTDVQKALVPCGIVPDAREFTPHVTLARLNKKYSRDDLNDFLKNRKGFKTGKFSIEDFHLYESVQNADGMNYEILQSYFSCHTGFST